MRGIMVQTSARLLALLSLLQVRREWTGQELADRLEVGPRTIRRDIDKLRSLGYPTAAAPGVARGYRLGAGGRMQAQLLDDAAAGEVVYSGHRRYLVAFDLDRDDWRTFRLDRIRGRARAGQRGRRRVVPGGDAAAFVRERLRGAREGDAPAVAPPGRIRLHAPASRTRIRIPGRYATVEPDGA